uniref:Cytokine dependent hematopoietic cell linker n=1 Tax=Anas platyrhynchos platyrhynchos TaxID=8840 RepID=A0A493U462_ANAPP|nr:cytokine-dependent hematopoietic cell linker [Anas platyrhynchos]|eukprot:XP_027313188.1 cytokine-dependent hematopoietic cell linker [Anas platyrhynchos]
MEANRKTRVQCLTDSNSIKKTIPKNRSCPNILAEMNLEIHPKEYERRSVLTNAHFSDKNFTGEDQADFKSCSELYGQEEDDYETINSSTLEPTHALRILPPKPLQESEYADKRYLMPSGITSEMSSQHPSQSPQYLAKCTSALEGRSMVTIRGERGKIHGPQPFPPPRPLKTLPKQYQPLPPEPKISSQVSHTRKTLSQAHTFPISAKLTRHISLRELNEASGREKVTDLMKKLELTLQSQQNKIKHLPESSFQYIQSSKDVCSSGPTLNVEDVSVKRSPSPVQCTSYESKSFTKHSLVKQEMKSLTQPIEKDLNKYEWYIGEYDRHEAEVALLQENTDETFLVRDCSKKSNTEPYVLVVYYGRRVYNIKVRFLEDSQQYALGTGLRGNDKFNSVKEIIDFYKYVPITLIDGKDKAGSQREQCYLSYPFKLRK